MSALLEVRDLLIRRNGQPVLQIETLAVEEGEVLAVIGPNGAGKSTLLLALAHLLQPDQGEIRFRGQSLENLGDLDYRRRIGLVLQEPLLMDTTAFENVASGLRFRRLPRGEVIQRAGEWLGRLGIAHLRDRPARRLSGGEAQRASLARALALQPEILLLDEPFSALDAPTRAQLIDDLQKLLATTQVTTIFVTHDRDEAMFLGERVAVLLGGRLRQVGPPEQVFNSPTDGEVAAFVGVETVISGQVIASSEGQVVVFANGLHLEAVGELEVGRPVLLCLRPEDVTISPVDGTRRTSARNRLSGRIVRMVPQGPLVRLTVDCGYPIVALITRASAREMGLAESKDVVASFKASAVHLIPR